MYYNRTLSNDLSALLEKEGKLRWLFDFVKKHDELDFLVGKNNSKEWLSVYRGLTRIVSISLSGTSMINICAAEKYQSMSPGMYGKKSIDCNFQPEIENLIHQIGLSPMFTGIINAKRKGTSRMCYQKNSVFAEVIILIL